MKITVSKKELSGALGIVTKAITGKSTMPVLEGVLLKAENGTLTLVGSDLNISIITNISTISLDEEGSLVVDAKMFSDIVRKMATDDIVLSTKDTKLNIKSGRTKLDVVFLDSKDYPKLPTLDVVSTYSIEDNALKDMVKTTAFAIAQDETRPILTGELFEIKDNVMTLVGLDGYRMATRKILLTATDCSIVIPGKTLLEVEKIIGNEEVPVKVSVNDKNVWFEYKDIKVISRLMEGNYVKYSSLFPVEYKTIVTVKRKEFLDMMDRIAVVKDATNLVKLSIKDNVIVATGKSGLGDIEDEMDCVCNGDGLEIAFNNKYLTEALKCLNVDDVDFNFVTNISPCKVTSKEDDNFAQLVLPVRLVK